MPADAPAPAGGGGVRTPPLEDTPDLTVEIRIKDGDSVLEWLFHSRYDVPLPSHKVTKDLGRLDAKTFAAKVMAELPDAEGTGLLEEAVRGAGREIMTAVPAEFWDVLNAVWRQARDRGVVPSLLLVTEDPYVPWELVLLDDDRFVDQALLGDAQDAGAVACLGSAWQVGRWLPPVMRTRSGEPLPTLPPETQVRVDAMAVVVGDYASYADIRPLPHAIEEGSALTSRYDAMRLTALVQELKRLLDCKLERNGQPFIPRAVHFACHGGVDLDKPGYTGIVLNDGDLRLTPMILRGMRLSKAAEPFVFLNACELGTATTVLSEYGGMAGAFLVEGCRAFLAPLWMVDNVVARDLALDFYRYTLEEGLPVAEAMRRLRASFGTPAAADTSTPLAYMFYGHPALHLVRAL